MYKEMERVVVIGIILVTIACIYFGLGSAFKSLQNSENALNQHNQMIIDLMESEVPAGLPESK